ncbi:MAG: efflux RND transporter periplasmic adaptor subunit [Pseudomonadota bacterium]|nr:efflux RND transporter periplasmic adaptor subunit [Pseudomonadota bacterium]
MNRPAQPEAGTAEVNRTLGLSDAGSRRPKARRLLIAGAVLVALLLVWRFARDDEPPAHYATEPARVGDLTLYVTATGTLEPTNQVEVGIEVSGTIAEVLVDYNDRVEVGQVLARLDTARLQAQVLQARATLASAQARLRTAQARVTEAANEYQRLERVRALSGGKVPSQSELDRARAALLSAQAEEAAANAAIGEAEARLEVNETDLSKAIIRSPIDGVVLDRAVDAGQTVAASLQTPVLFTLAEDLKQMDLHVDVDEADVGRVAAGQSASFSVAAYPDREFPARIREVRYAPQSVEGVVTYETILSVANDDLALRPGMTATADILVEQLPDVLLVPDAALRFAPPPGNLVQRKPNPLSRLFGRRNSGPPLPTPGSDILQRGERVWTLREGSPTPVPVTVGTGDGRVTRILSGDITDGTELIVRRLSTDR